MGVRSGRAQLGAALCPAAFRDRPWRSCRCGFVRHGDGPASEPRVGTEHGAHRCSHSVWRGNAESCAARNDRTAFCHIHDFGRRTRRAVELPLGAHSVITMFRLSDPMSGSFLQAVCASYGTTLLPQSHSALYERYIPVLYSSSPRAARISCVHRSNVPRLRGAGLRARLTPRRSSAYAAVICERYRCTQPGNCA